MLCRCGHARHYHRPTANAISKKRRLGDRRPARQGCRWMAIQVGRKVCECRDYTPQEAQRR